MTWPHITIEINTANEHGQFCGIARAIHMQDSIDFLLPWLETSGCRPIAEPVNFLNCPFALEWIRRLVTGTITAFVAVVAVAAVVA